MTHSRVSMHGRKLSRRAWLKLAAWGTATTLSGSGCARPPAESALLIPTPASSSALSATTTTAQPTPPPATDIPTTTPTSTPGLPPPTPPPIPSATPVVPATASATPEPVGPVSEPAQSLEARIGQMLLVGFRGLEIGPDHPIVRDIRDLNLGGVVLFDYDVTSNSPVRNIASREQVIALVAALQALASTPLLITIDQEGGKVARLKEQHGFPSTMSAQALGETGDPALTYRQASEMAALLAALGVNLNLAPVVDLNVNPDNPIIGRYGRSFGADPEIVTAHSLEFIKAHHSQGVRCTLKHFPGHGSSIGDTHFGVVDVTQTWSQRELEPYAAIIAAGMADTIMTAHVFNSQLDPSFPATLSQPTITGILREQLGYGGVVICDDIQMGAIRAQFGFEESIRRAIEAGVDIITIANNSLWEEGIVERSVAIIRRLVEEGTLSETRIDESYQRIQGLKLGLHAGATLPAPSGAN